MAERVLYSFRRCPYAMRARLALHVSGLAYEHREIVLRDKPASMLELSPKGTVPIMALEGGSVLDESLDIMRWALGQNDPEEWLSGTHEALIATNDGAFKHHLDRYKYPNRYDGVDASQQRTQGLEILRGLDERLLETPFLSGAHFGFTDAAIAPFIRQFANTDREWFAAQDLPRLQTWLGDFVASERFITIMAKFPLWQDKTHNEPVNQS